MTIDAPGSARVLFCKTAILLVSCASSFSLLFLVSEGPLRAQVSAYVSWTIGTTGLGAAYWAWREPRRRIVSASVSLLILGTSLCAVNAAVVRKAVVNLVSIGAYVLLLAVVGFLMIGIVEIAFNVKRHPPSRS